MNPSEIDEMIKTLEENQDNNQLGEFHRTIAEMLRWQKDRIKEDRKVIALLDDKRKNRDNFPVCCCVIREDDVLVRRCAVHKEAEDMAYKRGLEDGKRPREV